MPTNKADLVVKGSVIVYWLHDVGYSVDLERAVALLASREPVRVRPEREEARTIVIQNPPLDVALGVYPVDLDGRAHEVRLSARVFDFGVCAMRGTIDVGDAMPWDEYGRLGAVADSSAELIAVVGSELERLLALLRPAIERPDLAVVSETYVVFRVTQLVHADGSPATLSEPTDAHLVSLLVNERQELSPAARRELVASRFSYYADELTVLTWDNALVIDPRPADRDVEYILEFANAQLLELRFYDEVLDRELPRIHAGVALARRKRFHLNTRRFSPLLSALQSQVIDVTETVERVENSFKVTDDVHLARVYAAALKLFREDAWRRGIDRKLGIMRETYAMLNDEAQAVRSELLEAAIVLLIVVEIVLGLTLHR